MASSDWFCCTVLSRSIFDAASCLCHWFSRVCVLFPLCKPGRFLLEWAILTFYSMIMRQEIPYARVLATVPREMKDRLPPELTAILEVNVSVVWLRNTFWVVLGLTLTKTIPNPDRFHRGIMALALFYQRRFELDLPSLNSPMVLFRLIKRLALPSMRNSCLVVVQSILANKF